MADSSTPDMSNGDSNNLRSTTEELNELRSLLLGLDPPKVKKLYERLDNPQIHAEDVSQLLPAAIILRSMQDKLLSEAMVPAVEESIQLSVKKDLTVLSDIIFPVIGPASRKAIATALEAAIQSLNQSIEYSLSPQSFKWRLEALQTGKSFGEVVLLRTLLYRVEQVFLIHKQTGLVLQHVAANAVAVQDADLVSAMLTAIQDFVRDSFSAPTGESLATLQFGELTIWIEQGPQALLAAIIRGNPPKESRLIFQEALEKIHLKQSSALHAFRGDAADFAASRSYLEACLQTRYQKQEKHFPYIWVVSGMLAIALGIWSFFSIRDRLRWSAYVEKLNAQPGIVVTTAKRRHGRFFISGLRDPLAADPTIFIKQANLNPDEVESHWEPYLSLSSRFISTRANQVLQPPKTVSLTAKNGILQARGTAPLRWITEARRLVLVIPGVAQFNDNLVPTDLREFELNRRQIEQQVLLFGDGTTELLLGQENNLHNLATRIQQLSDSAQLLDKNVRIQIIGHATSSGSEQENVMLSKARAERILATLTSNRLKISMSAVGAGSRQPLRNGLTAPNEGFNRSVSFKVILTDVPQQGQQ